MSNASSRVPRYCRHKASGQAVVRLANRDIYLGKYRSAASFESYRRIVAQWSNNSALLPASREEVTVSRVMVAYLRFAQVYYRKHGKPTREYEMIRECCRFIRRLYSRTPAVDFGPLRLKTVRQAMIEADHSRKFINKNIERIRRMFKWAVAEEMIPASVPQALNMVTGLRKGSTEARETAPILPVDGPTVEATLEHLPEVVADMVRLQHYSGMSPAAVCMLRPCDLDRSESRRFIVL